MYVTADTVCWNLSPVYELNLVVVALTIGVADVVLSNSKLKLYGATW